MNDNIIFLMSFRGKPRLVLSAGDMASGLLTSPQLTPDITVILVDKPTQARTSLLQLPGLSLPRYFFSGGQNTGTPLHPGKDKGAGIRSIYNPGAEPQQ